MTVAVCVDCGAQMVCSSCGGFRAEPSALQFLAERVAAEFAPLHAPPGADGATGEHMPAVWICGHCAQEHDTDPAKIEHDDVCLWAQADRALRGAS